MAGVFSYKFYGAVTAGRNWLQARSAYYKAYAERMASWGFLVVQYNLPLFWVIPDANEADFQCSFYE